MEFFKMSIDALVKFRREGMVVFNKKRLLGVHPVFCELVRTEYSTKAIAKPKLFIKIHDLNRAISDAEKIVGYPTTYFSLRCMLSEEFSFVASQLPGLVNSGHPISETSKRLFYHGKSNRKIWGLLVLLLSKAAGHAPGCSDAIAAQDRGITPRQQNLSEITEMIETVHCIHKGVLNLSSTLPNKEEFGNKLSVLMGAFFLSNVWKGFANLRNCKVVDLLSRSVGDFLRSEFLGERDKHGNPLPFKGMNIINWEEKTFLCAGSVLANSCKASLELAGHNESVQAKGFDFGKNVAFAWQACTDLQPFICHDPHFSSAAFDLTSLPVTFHLEDCSGIIEVLRDEIGDDISNLDFTSLHHSVLKGKGIEKTKRALQRYSETAEDILSDFGQSSASKALSNIIMALRL